MQLDCGSLDRAADLAALYEDRTWVEELEPPKTHDKRGRALNNPAPPDSCNRFAQWLRGSGGSVEDLWQPVRQPEALEPVQRSERLLAGEVLV